MRRTAPLWRLKFWGVLYRLYSSNKITSGLLRYRITPFGYLVGIGIVLAGALRLGSRQNTLFGIIACLVALLLVAFVAVLFRRANLKITRSLPRVGTVGEPLRYKVNAQNSSRFPVSSARLIEIAPHNVPSKDVFVHSVEPGEELRNAFDRLFIVYRWYWLTGSKESFNEVESDSLKLAGKEKCEKELTIVPKTRGSLKLSNMKVILPDPLFIFQRCRSVTQEEESVLILPKRYRIRNLQLVGEAQNQVGGEAQSRQIGQSSEFVSLRGYRPGDPIKHVDWKSWAKTGEPVVREYEDVFYPHHGLVLDTGVHPLSHAEFEEAVSIAASFACSIDTEEGLLDLVLMQQDTKVVTVGKGVERLDEMMEVLACAEIETKPDWAALTKSLMQVAPDLSGCIMVFAEWSEERMKLVNKTAVLGVNIVCFIVHNDKEKMESLLLEYKSSVPVHLLKVGEVQEGLDQALESSLLH